MSEVGRSRYLSVNELSEDLGFSRDWVYNRTKAGASDPLPFHRVGRSICFDPDEVKRYMASHGAGSCDIFAGGDGIARDRSKRMLSRRRRQKGHVRKRGRRTKYWEGVYYEFVVGPDGEARRQRKFVFVGYLTDFRTEKDAHRKLDEILSEINAQDYQPRSVVTLRDFTNNTYIPVVLKTKKPSTARDARSALQKWIMPQFGDRRMTEITKLELQKHFVGLLGSGLAWLSVNKLKNYLSGVYSAAINMDCGVKSNPVKAVKLGARPPRPEIDPPTDEQVAAIEAAIGDEEHKTMWWSAAVLGVRVGELRALRRNSIDWKHGKLNITESRFEGQTVAPKSRRARRRIDLSPAQLKRLEEYFALSPNASPDDYLFPSDRGGGKVPLCTKWLMQTVIQPTAAKLGIKRIGWHMLRKWNNTTLDEEGFSIKVRQERLGHASASVNLEHYTFVRDSASRRAAEAIDRRLEEARKKLQSANVGTNVGTLEFVNA
ncbi:MAG: tyrosine-type recombinase/integrase [Terriglobia bacterium]